MINKLKKALDNQESIKSTILMYGENDFFEEEVFILDYIKPWQKFSFKEAK